jgi:hypothetical protein
LRERGFEDYVEVLCALGELGLRPGLPVRIPDAVYIEAIPVHDPR